MFENNGLAGLVNLTTLTIADANLEHMGAQHVFSKRGALEKMQKLETFDISENIIGLTGLARKAVWEICVR